MKKLILSFLTLLLAFSGLNAQIPYGVYQVPFQPISLSNATEVNLTDDSHSGVVQIGFPFRYFGTEYTQLVISSNGYVTFDLSNANMFSDFAVSANIPDAQAPNNSIFFTWCDLNPSNNGTVSYKTIGESPNRQFVVQYTQVPLFACNQSTYTGQLVLFETTNDIEVHITNKPFCNNSGGLSSVAIEGIQNANGTEAFVVPGRNNSGVWQAFNDAWRFDPDTVSAAPCVMSGRVIADFNGNCIMDGVDYAIPGQTLIRDGGDAFTQTNPQGVYTFEADTGNYTIGFNGLEANLPFADIVCPDGAQYALSYTEAGSSDVMLDFFLQPDSSCSDPRVNLMPASPLMRCAGNDSHQMISVTNNGLLPQFGYSVTLTIPDSVYLYETIPAFTTQDGNTFTWDFTDTLVYGEFVSIHLYDSVSCWATDGLSKCFSASISSLNDCNVGNNSDDLCMVLNGSYDPNHIQVLDHQTTNSYVEEWEINQNEEWYTYRIQFQNTGTAPAQTVVVTDILPNFFDYSSVDLLGSSHEAMLVNTGDGIIRFVHYGINLPDSSVDYDASIGTVIFRVRALQTLMPGQEVLNQASIVFDVNDPIITNWAKIGMPEPSTISSAKSSTMFYPNPAANSIRLFGASSANVRILDLSGRMIAEYSKIQPDQLITLDFLSNGVYLIEVSRNNQIQTERLIISRN